MKRLSKTDELLLARYLDGEMTAGQRADFESRLAEDPALQAAEAEARQQSGAIRDSDPLLFGSRIPVGFATSVVQSVRQMPSREDLIAKGVEEEAVCVAIGHARRLLTAAVVVCGVSLLFGLKVLVAPDTGSLQASQQELQELDKKVKEMKTAELQRLRQNR